MSSSKPTKREITRGKVIKAAIDSIYRDGFHAAHTNRIAKEAGVSWGVLQYHFGDKDGLLQAVLDHIFDDFLQTLASAELDGENLRDRLNQMIDITWALISKKEYRVSMAILRNAGKDKDSKINGQKQVKQWSAKMAQLWDELLQEDVTDVAMSETAMHLLFATLRGLADDINPRARLNRNAWERERAALGDAVAYLLATP